MMSGLGVPGVDNFAVCARLIVVEQSGEWQQQQGAIESRQSH